jgi:hypothetical protein
MGGQILPDNPTSTKLLGSLTCRKAATCDRRLYFSSEGRHAEEFYARKIRRLRPGLNPRTWVPEASMLTARPPKSLKSTLHVSIVQTLLIRRGPTPFSCLLHSPLHTCKLQHKTTSKKINNSQSTYLVILLPNCSLF